MNTRTRARWFNVLLLAVVLLGPGLSVAPTLAQTPEPPTALVDSNAPLISLPEATAPVAPLVNSDPALNVSRLYPASMDPPSTCSVPGQAPFGADVEILWGPDSNYTTSRIDQAPIWSTQRTMPSIFSGLPIPPTSNYNVALAALGSDTVVAVWRDSHPARLKFAFRTAESWSPYWDLDAPSNVVGNPVVVTRHAKSFVVFVRDSNDYIRTLEWNDGAFGIWETVPGLYYAASDPVPVVLDPHHIVLFFKDTNGNVLFSEWVAGIGWRDEPISLGRPTGYTLSTNATAGLAAVSPNGNRVAVFAHTSNNGLWVREWSSLNESDWSDTAWSALATSGVAPLTPAVVTRHANQMGVAAVATMSNGLLGARYWEWTATATSSSWKSPVNLPLPSSSFGRPLTMVGTSTDEMWLLGVDQNSTLRSNRWTDPVGADGSWGGWNTVSSGWKASTTATDWTVAAVARQPYDITLIGRNSSSQLIYHTYSAVRVQPTATAQSNTRYGESRAQAIAMVGGKPIWVTLWRNSTGSWIVQAAQTSNWALGSGQFNLGHPDSGSTGGAVGRRYLIAADVDADGDDEIVVATLNAAGTRIDVSVGDLTASTSAILLSFTHTYYSGQPAGSDINVAAGDLDGDGVGNEVVVGYNKSSSTVRTILAQFTNGAWQYKATNDWSFSASGDLELAIGQTQYGAAEELVITKGMGRGQPLPIAYYAIYQWTLDARGTRNLTRVVTSDPLPTTLSYESEFSTALALGDVDADGLQEIVYAPRGYVYVIDGNVNATTWAARASVGGSGTTALALGDVDRDGRAEIVHSVGSEVHTLELVLGSSNLNSIGFYRAANPGVPLVADLDDDSFEATLVGCTTSREVSVISVVHAAPTWYEDGASVNGAQGEAANSTTSGVETEDGWKVNLGESLSVGFSVEQAIPIVGTKIAEVRGSVTVDLMSSVTGGSQTYEETTVTQGFEFGDNASLASRGMVVYDEASYRCYFYDVYRPSEPANAARAMACTPTTAPAQTFASIEMWYMDSFKASVDNGSWVDVNGHSTDVTTYPNTNPIDKYRVLWEGDDILIGGDVYDGMSADWDLETTTGSGTITGGAWELNTTVSAGATVGVVTMDASVTAGYGQDWSRTTTWGESLYLGGGAYKYQVYDCATVNPNCTPCLTCQNYTIVPYIYQDTAVSEAGATYPYLVVDYYVPAIGALASAATSEPAPHAALVGVTPQAPVITSTTHPVSATWYTTNTVAFEWGQPAGDPAQILGYRWILNETPVVTQTSLSLVLTDTHTYTDVPDGIHYFHIEARGDNGEYSPISTLPVRVDVNPPQVEVTLDPLAPTGLNDWYNTPVTFTVTATDTTGSGVDTIQVSTDGNGWQGYTEPLVINSDISTYTLWARAIDAVGHISDPVSTTVRVDLAEPSLLDGDGYRLTYASVITDEVGNAQLVLGGALSDALSGRFMMEVKMGDGGAWRAVNQVGEFSIPEGNWLSTTMTTVNWIYTPTFEARGAWTIWGRGTDAAGSQTDALDISGFFWEPDADPDFTETQVSVVPEQAAPGDVVTFTLGVRNIGFQESNVALTNTVPAGLTVLPETISGAGIYDDGVITWNLDALWPGETRYLFFSAQVAAGVAVTQTVENRLDLLGYWVWEDPYGVMPPAPPTHAAVATTTLTLLPDAAAFTVAASPPTIFSAMVLDGAIVNDPEITVLLDASANAEFLYVREWVWDTLSGTWTLTQESGWVPFETGNGLNVTEDAFGRQARYEWTLSSGDGVKYLGLWVADADHQVTQLNAGNLIYTNLVSPNGQMLSVGQRVQYRVPLRPGDLAIFNLVTLSGDADLYVWKPRFAFRPHFFSNDAQEGFHLDVVGFLAEEERMHIVEVEAVSDNTFYRLETAGDLATSNVVADDTVQLTEALRNETQLTLAEKDRPAHPLTLSTPYGLADATLLPESPTPQPHYTVYLPLVLKP